MNDERRFLSQFTGEQIDDLLEKIKDLQSNNGILPDNMQTQLDEILAKINRHEEIVNDFRTLLETHEFFLVRKNTIQNPVAPILSLNDMILSWGAATNPNPNLEIQQIQYDIYINETLVATTNEVEFDLNEISSTFVSGDNVITIRTRLLYETMTNYLKSPMSEAVTLMWNE